VPVNREAQPLACGPPAPRRRGPGRSLGRHEPSCSQTPQKGRWLQPCLMRAVASSASQGVQIRLEIAQPPCHFRVVPDGSARPLTRGRAPWCFGGFGRLVGILQAGTRKRERGWPPVPCCERTWRRNHAPPRATEGCEEDATVPSCFWSPCSRNLVDE
jgi:hypothetical protein